MSDRIIAGTVNANGSIRHGNAFSVTRTSKGHYLVAFRPAFASLSGGASTQVYPNDGNTKDNVVIVALGPNDALLKTGDDNGNAQDRDFTFVFAGTGEVAAVDQS